MLMLARSSFAANPARRDDKTERNSGSMQSKVAKPAAQAGLSQAYQMKMPRIAVIPGINFTR